MVIHLYFIEEGGKKMIIPEKEIQPILFYQKISGLGPIALRSSLG